MARRCGSSSIDSRPHSGRRRRFHRAHPRSRSGNSASRKRHPARAVRSSVCQRLPEVHRAHSQSRRARAARPRHRVGGDVLDGRSRGGRGSSGQAARLEAASAEPRRRRPRQGEQAGALLLEPGAPGRADSVHGSVRASVAALPPRQPGRAPEDRRLQGRLRRHQASRRPSPAHVQPAGRSTPT